MIVSDTLSYPPSLTAADVSALINDVVAKMQAAYPDAGITCSGDSVLRKWTMTFHVGGESFNVLFSDPNHKDVLVTMDVAAKHMLVVSVAKAKIREEWKQALSRSGR